MRILEYYKVAWIYKYDSHYNYLYFGKDPIPIGLHKGKFVFVKNRYKVDHARRGLLSYHMLSRKV